MSLFIPRVCTVTELLFFAGVVLLYRPINKEGGPKYRFAYVTIKGKSGPVYCTEREQNSIYIINIIIDFSQARIQALSNTPINH